MGILISGEGGNITPSFPHHPINTGLLTQTQKRQQLRYFWLVAVVSCCLAQFRLSSSTLSAQPPSSDHPDEDGTNGGDNLETAAAYARYSSRNQNEKSNAQQFEEVHQVAPRNLHVVPLNLHFQDDAISGRKRNRKGLNALLDAARKGLFKIIYMWDISRLARELVITLPIVKDLVYNHGVRIISISDGIDTNQPSWETVLMVHAMLAQQKIKQLIEDVRRGQQNNAKDKYSNGDYCFGYVSVNAPGQEGLSRSRRNKPKKVIKIDLGAADWVRRIFNWYVIESRSIYWIAKELKRLGAPRDHRSTSSKGWTTGCVVHVLENPKYIGIWGFGKRKNKCNPLTGDVSIELRVEGDADYSITERPDLRIIENELFYRAVKKREGDAVKFATMRDKNGRLRGSTRDLQNPRHMLQGLMRCSKCGRTLQQNGLRGLYLQCSGYPSGLCDVKTSLLRKYAEQQIVTFFKGVLLEREDLRERLFQAVTEAWHTHQTQQPQERKALEQRRADVEKRITGILDFIENVDQGPELSARLRERRREKEDIQRQLEALGRDQQLPEAPTRTWMIEQLEKLHQLLESEPTRAGIALRSLVGSITVREVEFPGLKRKKLVGTFNWDLGQLGVMALGMKPLAAATVEEVTLDFALLPVWAQRAEEVKALYDQNLSAVDIAARLGLKFGAIAKALNWWYTKRGLPVPSGNEKRSRIIYAPKRDLILPDVMKHYHEGWLLERIASEFSSCTNTITAMVKKWHTDQGLPWVNGKVRQKQLRLKRESDEKNNQDAA